MPKTPEKQQEWLFNSEVLKRKGIDEIVRDYRAYFNLEEARLLAKNSSPDQQRDIKLEVMNDRRFQQIRQAMVDKLFDTLKKSADKSTELHELLLETFTMLRQNNLSDIPLFLDVVKTGLEEKIKEINFSDLSEQELFAWFMIFAVLSGSDVSKMDDYFLLYRDFLSKHGLSPDRYCKDQEKFKEIWEKSHISDNVRIISQMYLQETALRTPKTEEEKAMSKASRDILPSDSQGRFIDRPKHLWNQTHWTMMKGTFFGLAGLTGLLNIIGTGIRAGISLWDTGIRLVKERDPKGAAKAFGEGVKGVASDIFSSKGLTSALGFLFFAKGDQMLDAIKRGEKKCRKEAKNAVKEIKRRII